MDSLHINEVATIFSVIAGIGWFFWMRFQSLEKRFDSIEKESIKIKHSIDLLRADVSNNQEQSAYLSGNNKTLIDHKAERWEKTLKELETRFTQSLSEIKGYLTERTDYKPRG